MKYLLLTCAACTCLISFQKRGGYGYDVGEVYKAGDKKMKIVDAGEDFITIVWWNADEKQWKDTRHNLSKEQNSESECDLKKDRAT
jgi:hypothetical protein